LDEDDGFASDECFATGARIVTVRDGFNFFADFDIEILASVSDLIGRTTEAPLRRSSRRGRISRPVSRPAIGDSTAPFEPECQSFLGNLIARCGRF
jgi:hypothetical protein